MNLSFESTAAALGSAVLHFLWQGALIGLFVRVCLAAARKQGSDKRYLLSAAGLLMSLAVFVWTFVAALMPATGAGLAGSSNLEASLASAPTVLGFSLRAVDGVALLWFLGAAFMGLRFGLQCAAVQRLKTRDVSEPGGEWLEMFRKLQEDLGMTRGIRLLCSGLAEVPMVVGWLSPVVLVPASAFTALSPDQLRSLLAHELEHIRRHDHWLNAAQAVCEVVLFFHPAVWWMSKQMRIEREFCCDDSSIRVTGNPRLLAEALAAMEALRTSQQDSQAVLASNGGPLMQRIRRILSTGREEQPDVLNWQVPAGLLLAGVLAVTGNAYAQADKPVVKERAAKIEKQKAIQGQKKIDVRMQLAEIREAVAAGILTAEEGRRAAEKVRSANLDKRRVQSAERVVILERLAQGEVEIKELQEELSRLVAAGKISEGHAAVRIDKLKQRLVALEQQLDNHKSALTRAEAIAKIETLAKEGKLTREEAVNKIASLDKKAADEAHLQAAIERLTSAVEAGRLTKAQADLRLAEYKEVLAGLGGKEVTSERFTGQDPKVAAEEARRWANVRQIEADVHDALRSGRMTREEAREVLARVQRPPVVRGARGSLERDLTRVQMTEEQDRLMKLVAEGKIAAKDAERRIFNMQKRAEAQEARRSALVKIEQLIKDGKLTREEGAAKIKAVREKFAPPISKERRLEVPVSKEVIRERLEAARARNVLTQKELDERLRGLRKAEEKEKAVKKLPAKQKPVEEVPEKSGDQ